MRASRAGRLLLRAYPPAFRERYGHEWLELLASLRAEPRFSGPMGGGRFWLEVLPDALLAALRMRLASLAGSALDATRAVGFALLHPRLAVEGLLLDARLALRSLARRPAFALAVLATLGLGLGAHLTIFSAVHALLGTPLPGARGERLVSLALQSREAPFPGNVSYPDYRDLAGLEAFESVVASMPDGLPLAVEGESPTLAYVLVVTPNYFQALGVPAAAGRVFAPGDEADDVVVLSHAAWQRRFLGDPGVVGRSVRMGGRPFTVLGVAHRDFAGTAGLLAVDAFLPLGAYARVSPGTEQWLEARDARSLRAFARLRPGISLEQARAAVGPLSGQLDALRPEASRGVRIVVHPEAMTRLETAAPAFLPPIAALFLTLVGLLVLVAAFNVTGLALSRMVERRRELAVRQALGASRGRLLRPLVAENVLLGLGGGLIGLALATWATTWLGELRLASDVPLVIQLRPDARVFGLGLGLSALVGLGVGLAPGLLATRRDVATALRDRGAAAGRGRLRAALVVGQIAVSAALLVAGGLLLQSLGHFLRMDLGFRVERRALATLDVGLRGLDAERGEAFHRAVLERVRALPGVRRATQAALLPIDLSNSPQVVKAEGQADRPGQFAWTNAVESDYFETLGIPVLRGRGFADSDDAATAPRAVVSESLASLLWPGLEPLGRRLVIEAGAEELEVVGVARDSTYNLPGEARKACLYLALRQTYRSERTLVAETAGAAEPVLPRVREIVAALDPDMPVYDLRTLQAHIDGGKAAVLFRLGGALAGAFGVIGFVLAAIGLYGALAYAVGQRVPELAVRLALGATAGRLGGMVVGEGLRLAALGLVIGLPLAAALAAALQDLIVGLGPRDPGTYLAVAAGLLIGCAGAALLPAWRASRVDPLVSLRAD